MERPGDRFRSVIVKTPIADEARAKLPDDIREMLEEGDRRLLNAVLYGDPDYEPAPSRASTKEDG